MLKHCIGQFTQYAVVILLGIFSQTIAADEYRVLERDVASSVVFDGQDDYAELVSDKNVDFGGSFTIEAWVKVDKVTHFARLLDFFNQTGSDNIIFATSIAKTGKPRFSIYRDGHETVVDSPRAISIGHWTHLAATFERDTKTANLYINGALVATNNNMNIPSSQMRRHRYIGRSAWNGDALFKGAIHDFRMWNVARSQKQIIANNRAVFEAGTQGLIANYPLNISDIMGGSVRDHATGGDYLHLHGAQAGTARSTSADYPFTVPQLSVPQDYRAVTVSGLPKGVSIKGNALLPKKNKNGTYMQVVDLNALKNGALLLNIPQGFFGKFSLQVEVHAGSISPYAVKPVQQYDFVYIVPPKDDDLLFAKSGSIDFGEPIEQVTHHSDIYWGINKRGVVYSRAKNTEWKVDTDVDQGMRFVSIGSDKDGGIWAGTDDGRVYFRDRFDSPWQQVDGFFPQLAVQPNGYVWAAATNQNGEVYVRNGLKGEIKLHGKKSSGDWLTQDGFMRKLAVGADGQVWGIDAAGYVKNRFGISAPWYFTPSDAIDPKKVKSFDDNAPFDPTTDVFGDTSKAVPVNDPNFIPSYGGEYELSAKAKEIAVDNDGRVWVVTEKNDRYVRGSADQPWYLVQGKYRDIKSSFGVGKAVPLNVIINPKVRKDATVTISGLPHDVVLLDKNNQYLIQGGSIDLSADDATGLKLDVTNAHHDFYVNVELNTRYDGNPISTQQKVFIDDAELERSVSGGTVFQVADSRNNYTVERVGNSLVLTYRYDPTRVTRLLMTDVDYIRFTDNVVAIADYYKTYQLPASVNTSSGNIVMIAGVPAGAVVNNSVAMGNGVFALMGDEIQSGAFSIDFPTVEVDKAVELKVGVTAETSVSKELIGGARINGYANAKAYAEADAELSFSVGPDGVNAEARSYIGAGAVATAGGSVEVDGVGSASQEYSAEVTVDAEIEAQLTIDKTQISQHVKLGTQATVSATSTLEVEVDFVPGTSATTEGTAALTAYANVEGDSQLCYGDGCYGISGSAGAEAGIMATASGYASGSLAGVGGNAEGGVEAGLGVGINAGATAGYEDGELTVGVSGELAVLIGLDVDVNVVIDTNSVADTADLVGNGVIGGLEAVNSNMLTVDQAVTQYYVPAIRFVQTNMLPLDQAMGQYGVSAQQAVFSGIISVDDAVNNYGAKAGDFAGTAFDTAKDKAEDTAKDAYNGAKHFICHIFC
ncbi:LamG domain-containing protein [Pseudoalteromonas luteoviolacea]|uniref:LamG domain-containing protein n=1 Tax=Pseudoalteromonas luteoviolacea TaxID=43657 RepID=UPI001B398059|nr:LamG domain-containing protein [Pseudoalteromonas luteoviolacea]MBQ4839727.1 LamG domain-containing protein [Pseudoalteromonas luteoviolacea]